MKSSKLRSSVVSGGRIEILGLVCKLLQHCAQGATCEVDRVVGIAAVAVGSTPAEFELPACKRSVPVPRLIAVEINSEELKMTSRGVDGYVSKIRPRN